MKHWLLICLIILTPLSLWAADYEVDLGITPSDVFFDTDGPLVAGDHIRLYARVRNLGEHDVQGYVEFFQGSIPIGQSQVISVRAGGAPEEVFVDFVVPSGSFNIRADIKGTDPQDENADNDSAMTKLYSPIFDDDRDGVANSEDNCPNDPNPNQADQDADGVGDLCDDDDDNDGVTDDVENEIGSSPTASDTDADGVDDAGDAYPADPEQNQVPATLEEVLHDMADELGDSLPAQASADQTQATQDNQGASALSEDVGSSNLIFSPKAVFSYSRQSWNTFQFKALTPEVTGYRFEWDFADGVTSNRHSPEHEYEGFGDFDVSLTITDPNGQVSQDTTTVSVPFFTMQNNYVLMIVGLLSLLLLFGLVFTARMSFLPKRSAAKPDPEVPSLIVEDPKPEPQPAPKPVVADEPKQAQEAAAETPTAQKKRQPIKQISIRDGDLEE